MYFKLEAKTLVVRCNMDFVLLRWCKRSETTKVLPKRYGEGLSGAAPSVQQWSGLVPNTAILFLYLCLLTLFYYSVIRYSEIF